MSKIAIALAHGHATKWLQVVIHSLKAMKNDVQADIFVAHTWPGHPSIKAITETELGEGVTVIDCQKRMTSHATALDEILEYIEDKDYDYMFATETDCRACQNGWLDWYYNYMAKDEKIGMAGFFWREVDSRGVPHHYNINPSATLYRKDMLLQYHKECRENNSGTFWHPLADRDEKDGKEPPMDVNIKEVAGVFSETRGIKDPSPRQREEILSGVPYAAWFEPGAWLYYRALDDWKHLRMPVDHVYIYFKGYRTPEATYYGGRAGVKFIHYWGGTRAWDHLKHPVGDYFVKSCSPMWLDREHMIWEQTVPEKFRKIVPEIYKEMGLEGMGYDES